MFTKFKLLFLALCFSFLGTSQSFGQISGGLPDNFLDEQKFAVEFANVILQVSKEIELDHPQMTLKGIDKETFENIFKNKVQLFADLYDSHLSLPLEKADLFKNFFRYFKIDNIYLAFKQMVTKSRVFFRKKSFGVAIAVMMGIASEYLVPIILIQSGLSFLAPLSPFVPWSVSYLTIPNSLEKFRTKQKVIKALGSKEAYLDYKNQMNKVKSALKLETPEHFLFPIGVSGEGAEVAVVTRNSWFRSLLGKWGFFQSSISYESLKRFLLTKGISDKYIKYVSELDTGKDVKTSLIIQHILNSENDELKLLFRKQFSEHLFTTPGSTHWNGLYDWVKKAMVMGDLNDLMKLLKEVPPQIDIREILGVYEKMILPRYAENFELGYLEYRRVVRNFEAFKAEIIQSQDFSFEMENRVKFTNYLKDSLRRGHIKPCYNDHGQVLNFLLKSILR